MNITVPAGAQDPARPSASQDGLEALLRVLPHRYKPGLRALLTGPEPGGPALGHVYVGDEWLASALGLLGLGPTWGHCKKVTSAYAQAERRANSGRGFGSEAGQGLVEGGLADLHAGGGLAHGETGSEKSPGSDELVRRDHGLSASLVPAGFRGA
jgi:hypothetical protein